MLTSTFLLLDFLGKDFLIFFLPYPKAFSLLQLLNSSFSEFVALKQEVLIHLEWMLRNLVYLVWKYSCHLFFKMFYFHFWDFQPYRNFHKMKNKINNTLEEQLHSRLFIDWQIVRSCQKLIQVSLLYSKFTCRAKISFLFLETNNVEDRGVMWILVSWL